MCACDYTAHKCMKKKQRVDKNCISYYSNYTFYHAVGRPLEAGGGGRHL